MSESTGIVLDWTPGRNGVNTIAVRRGDELLHSDKLDPVRASARRRFADELVSRCPAVPRDDIERELLALAGGLSKASEPAAADAPEFDTGQIVRPELFHAADVSGLAVPAVRMSGGGPAGKWALLLRWHSDGKRERSGLESSIELPGGARLWVHPVPGDPEPTARAAWGAKARAAWLDGADVPNAADVWARVAERFTHYLDFPPDVAPGTVATLATWVLLTYTYPAWPAVPYLAIGGPMASGKSTLFRVLARLVFRPLESSNMTAACLFRTLHERGGTLLLDEAERLRDGSPEAGELRSVLLSGYKKGSPAIRLEKQGDTFQRVTFDLYGPKALACIGSLPEALVSRCVRIGMFRAAADSPKPRRRLDEDSAVWAGLRDDLHAVALEYGRDWLALANRADVVPDALGGRDFELWQPLLALAAWLESHGAAGLLGVLTEHAERTVESSRDDAVPESDELLLRLLAEHVVGGTARTLKAGDLLKQAREADGVTFKYWTPKGVGTALARYGLRTRKGTGSTGRTFAAVSLASLRRVQAAYGFDLALPPENVPHVPQVPRAGDSDG